MINLNIYNIICFAASPHNFTAKFAEFSAEKAEKGISIATFSAFSANL